MTAESTSWTEQEPSRNVPPAGNSQLTTHLEHSEAGIVMAILEE